MSEQPIWQSAVRATCNDASALGRMFVQGDDVYYFPEIPRKRNWLWRGLGPIFVGMLLVLLAVWMGLGGGARVLIPEWLSLGVEMASLSALVFFLLGGIELGAGWRKGRIPKGFLEDDEYIGMSLGERFAHSPNALHFMRDDIEELDGEKIVTVKTKLGDVLRIQTIPHDDTLLSRLRWGAHTERLPKEEIAEGGNTVSGKTRGDVTEG